MTRLQVSLSVSLAVLLALLLLGVGDRSSSSAMAEPKSLFPEAAQEAPAKLAIADSSGNEVVLTRSGKRWTIDAAGGYPAKAEMVDTVLTQLGSLDVRRPAVTLAKYHESLKVADDVFERRISLWPTADGEPVVLYLGTSPNFRITHARRADADEVYAVTDLASFEFATTISRWTPDMWPEDFYEQATWFQLENAQGSFACRKLGGGIWASADEGGAVDHEKVDTFLRAANGLWIRQPLGPVNPEYGFDTPLAKLTMKIGELPEAGEDGEPAEDNRREVVVLIGKKLEGDEKLYAMGRADFGFAASVRASSVKRLLNDTRAAIEPDPEPVPEAPVDGGGAPGDSTTESD